MRQDAFELAVGVCDADGVTTDAERGFLMGLARELGIDVEVARQTIENADALAAAPINLPAVGAAAMASAPPSMRRGSNLLSNSSTSRPAMSG